MTVDLTRMKPGETGIVTEIQGGHEAARRIHNMGIREGEKITKVSSHFWHGPQTVRVGKTQIALGFGMSRKILVEIE